MTMFFELALLGWTLVKGFKHLRFIPWCVEGGTSMSKNLLSDLWKSHKSLWW